MAAIRARNKTIYFYFDSIKIEKRCNRFELKSKPFVSKAWTKSGPASIKCVNKKRHNLFAIDLFESSLEHEGSETHERASVSSQMPLHRFPLCISQSVMSVGYYYCYFFFFYFVVVPHKSDKHFRQNKPYCFHVTYVINWLLLLLTQIITGVYNAKIDKSFTIYIIKSSRTEDKKKKKNSFIKMRRKKSLYIFSSVVLVDRNLKEENSLTIQMHWNT